MASTGNRYPKIGQKVTGFSTAVGQWDSSGPWRRTNAEQIPQRILAWLGDKMVVRGRRVILYQPVNVDSVGAVPCTCERVSTDASQRRCYSCYGAKALPGFTRFLSETLFFGSAEYANFTLTNALLNSTLKPFQLQLAPGVTSGTIVTPDKNYDNSAGLPWDVAVNGFLRAAGSTLTLEISTDGGVTWNAVTLSGSAGLYVGTIDASLMPTSGVIRTRITLTRPTANDATPSFEILRIRRPSPEKMNPVLHRYRPDWQAGEILIEKTWVREKVDLSSGSGRVINHEADGSWAMPLNFYDKTIVHDSPEAKISDAGTGPHPFYVFTDGVEVGTIYPIVEIDYDTQLSGNSTVLTQQGWVDQMAQPDSPYALVW